jgi:hypothetical protein
MAKDTFAVTLRSQHFLCQASVLSTHSHYFQALRSWPGVEASSGGVKLPGCFEPKSFGFIYGLMTGSQPELPEEDAKEVLELCDYLQISESFLTQVLDSIPLSPESLLTWIQLASKKLSEPWLVFVQKLWKEAQTHLSYLLEDEGLATISARNLLGILDSDSVKSLDQVQLSSVLKLAKSKTPHNSWFELIALARQTAEQDFDKWSLTSPPTFVWEIGGLEYSKLRSHEYFKKSFSLSDSYWSLKSRMTTDQQFIGLFISLDISNWNCGFTSLSYKYQVASHSKQATLAFPRLWRSSYGPARCIAAPLKADTVVEVWVRTNPLHSLILEQVSAELSSSVMQARPKEMLSLHMRDVFSLLEQSPALSADDLLHFLAKFLLEHSHEHSEGLVRCLVWTETSTSALYQLMSAEEYLRLPDCFREALELECSSRELPSSLRLT